MASRSRVRKIEDENKIFNLNFKSFIMALVMIALLMVATYFLTTVIPSGEYQRDIVDGNSVVVSGTYEEVEGGISLVDWLCAPVTQLLAPGGDGVTILAIIFFLLVIGGAFSALDAAGILAYMLGTIYERFNGSKYRLMAVITLFFMMLGSMIGSFEETVPLVPIASA